MEHKETSQEITVADFDGTVLASYSKWGDFPDTYGNLKASLKIIGNEGFMAYGSRGFLFYDFEGVLQSLEKHVDSQYQGVTRIGLGIGMEGLEDGYLYRNTVGGDKLPNGAEDYAALRPLVFLNPQTGETKPLLHFPESSIFLRGRYFFRNAWDPAFTIADHLIYVAFGLEPVIYSYEATPPYSFVSSIPLDLPDYNPAEGEKEYTPNVRFFGQARTSGKILNIKMVNDFFIIAYFPGFNAADREASFSNKSPEGASNFWNGMREKYPHRMAIFDASGNRLSDFESKRLIGSSMVLRNGELWMQEKPDEEVERDYFRLFRVGLKVNELKNNED
ncbi:hypothetical protein [Cyclobacterium lianum]|uniref:hypothetical protein n=1 Tax=Cyclobacterium lianum TaxID=388280 RepID=UPI0009351B8C|nr:hypothetical protein [Cyclobacterium lianum]